MDNKCITKKTKILTKNIANDYIKRIERASDIEIDKGEFTKNPASRAPETQEEAIQYLYYAVGLFESETDWVEYAKNMYLDEYPLLANISYQRAQRIYEKNRSNNVYM
ncbi:hypothetical protein WH390_03295 [Candidatus Arsenophonus nilaparvatae]|uniref:hypothetical protein n=1 Tax=Candidatus Arsenophonus nilaparvatae TaxID=1247023 RepID=UPI00068FE40A|nr:hypothetical protein [Candidatus Arsenophonus nilaparvatae]